MTYSVVNKQGHYEVYINGKFYCSVDNMSEANREIENYKES